jgi:ABC-2 type transport system permease protein
VKAFVAQLRAEVTMTMTRGESLLLVLGIPVGLLVFFSLVDVLPTGTKHPITFLAPGVLAMAVLSTAFTSLAIATGFERSYLVLKRLGTTPLGRPRLLAAKTGGVLVVIAIQVVIITIAAALLGWSPHAGVVATIVTALPAVALATIAFAALALLMAGTLRAELTLAAANAGFILLMLISGMVIPVSKLPGAMRAVSEILPSEALAHILHAAASGGAVGTKAWIVLAVWAVISPVFAARLFRWE